MQRQPRGGVQVGRVGGGEDRDAGALHRPNAPQQARLDARQRVVGRVRRPRPVASRTARRAQLERRRRQSHRRVAGVIQRRQQAQRGHLVHAASRQLHEERFGARLVELLERQRRGIFGLGHHADLPAEPGPPRLRFEQLQRAADRRLVGARGDEDRVHVVDHPLTHRDLRPERGRERDVPLERKRVLLERCGERRIQRLVEFEEIGRRGPALLERRDGRVDVRR